MTPQQKKDVLAAATSLAIEIKSDGNDLFVWYSPHVNQVSLHLYLGGWAEKTEPTLIRHVDLSDEAKHSDAMDVLVDILSTAQKESEDD